MMAEIPKTMRALIAPEPTGAPGYIIRDIPTPTITRPEQVIVRSYAASLGSGEVMLTGGAMSFIQKVDFPCKLGFEGSGTVVAVGSEVKTLKPGDDVYGLAIDKPMFRQEHPGWASEYAICDDRFLLKKPSHLSHAEAASMMGNAVTGYQAIQKALELRQLKSLEGMTVYIPAALGGLGSMAIQLAKNVYGAEKIITSVSTRKVPLVDQYLPGLVDQIVDYQTQTLTDHITPGSVDFVISTQVATFAPSIPLLNPSSGILINLTGLPSIETATKIFGAERMVFWLRWALILGQYYYSWKLRGTHIAYEMVSGGPEIRADIEKVAELIEKGLVKPVVAEADLDDLEAVREGCRKAGAAKGALGKFVIRIP